MLEFRILGPLEVVSNRRSVRLGGPRQRATLAILLLNANRVVSVDQLVDRLYSGAAPVTAVTQVQRQISELRKALGSASVIETRAPGYVLHISPDQLDLARFERTAGEAAHALERDDPKAASELFRTALELWRGPALADVGYESFAAASIDRLEEIRLVTLEQRIDADLRLGRHADLVGELEELVATEPLRERLRAQLMLALYRSGRQAEALDVYRRTREVLVEEFGIEPTSALHDLERAILTQDPALELAAQGSSIRSEPNQAVLVVSATDDRLDALLGVAEPLASLPERELIVVRLLTDERELSSASSALTMRRARLKARARSAAFTTFEPASDVVRLATSYEVGLVLMDVTDSLSAEGLPADLAATLERAPADVALLFGAVDLESGDGVFVPFGGGEHDWAALEVGAWLASATRMPLRLVGPRADARRGRRDSSRLLANASLAVQRIARVDSAPVLAEPTEEGLATAVESASIVVVGISPRWRSEGVGAVRQSLVRASRVPILLVHAGPRPGGLAPRETRTRFSWTIEA